MPKFDWKQFYRNLTIAVTVTIISGIFGAVLPDLFVVPANIPLLAGLTLGMALVTTAGVYLGNWIAKRWFRLGTA